MIIVGLNTSGYVSSAAFVVDGELVFGCAEERLDRRKQSKYFPHRSIRAGLEYIGAKLSDVDQFALGFNPGISIAGRTRAGLSDWPDYPGSRLFSNPNHLLPYLGGADFVETEQLFRRSNGRAERLRYVTHHLAHAANAFLLSGFRESAVLTCDGYGERATTMWAMATEGGIHPIREIEYPHSIGSLYAALTQFLGFQPHSDEWKVMGAAAYGDSDATYEKLKQLIRWDGEAVFELDLSYFNFFQFDISPMYKPKLTELLGSARSINDPIEQRHFDIAAGLQRLIETYLIDALRWLRRKTGCPNLCFSGGSAMNSVFNGRATLCGLFENVYVPFAPDDSGNSIGAALWIAWQEGELKNFGSYQNRSCLGRAYSPEEIERDLIRFRLPYTRPDDICETVGQLLTDEQIVGWFQGRMEFGPRALGSRSILADPRNAKMRDKINSAVKFREGFRPFAPAILSEAEMEYFVIDRPLPVRYMEKVFAFRESVRARIPAVVHVDGTGRLQTVHAEDNPLFERLIRSFFKRTGIPLLLNTSFNVSGEPLVESPADAIRTFYSSGLEALALGPFLLRKS